MRFSSFVASLMALGLVLLSGCKGSASMPAGKTSTTAAVPVATPSAPAKPEARTALNSPSDRFCRATYDKLYGKGSAKIRMVFGYKDTRPTRFVGDRHERLAFVQRILEPCEARKHACGFVRDGDNADLFTKTIVGPKGEPVRVSLTVTHSSVGSDDAANREDAFQTWQSSYAQNAFYGGIERADVVFYNGHSRFGGGPDFNPPRLTAEGNEVDSKFYRDSRLGIQNVLKKLRTRTFSPASDRGLRMLGLFSCASSQHFSDEIARDSESGLVASRALIYYADALENSLAALSALLEMRCEKDFKAALKEGGRFGSSTLQGFF